MAQRIVINACFGGFGLSTAAHKMLKKLGAPDVEWRENRDHPLLVRVVDELGEAASDNIAKLKIVEIPDGVEWHIEEYDGNEWIAENHRTWY